MWRIKHLHNSQAKKFMGNLTYAFLGNGISLVQSTLLSLIIPKILGIEEFSYWQLFIFYSNYVGLLHFGLTDGVYLRYGGTKYEDLNKSLIGSQYKILFIFQLLLTIFISIAVSFLNIDVNRINILYMTAIYMIVANLCWFLGYVFQAINETRHYSISIIIDKIIFIILFIGLYFANTLSYKKVIIIFIVSRAISLIYCTIIGKEIVFTKWIEFRLSISEAFKNMQAGINLTISSIASILSLGAGRFFIDMKWGLISFGKISLAISIINFTLTFLNQFSIVFFPALRQTNKIQQKNYFFKIRNVLNFILPFGIVLYIPIKNILILWLPKYHESFEYLLILLPLCIFDGRMQILCNTYLKTLRKERYLLLINIFTCVISIVLSAIGTYIFGSVSVVIISMVLSITIRDIIAELYLLKEIKGKIDYDIFYQCLIVLLMVLLSTIKIDLIAFLCCLGCYIVYILMNKNKVIDFLQTMQKTIHLLY